MKTYQVQGWLKESGGRVPLRISSIRAPNGFEAARQYAEGSCIVEREWNDGTASPLVVIRVEEAKQS